MALATYRLTWEKRFEGDHSPVLVLQHREENPTRGGPDWREMTESDFSVDFLRSLLDLGIVVSL